MVGDAVGVELRKWSSIHFTSLSDTRHGAPCGPTIRHRSRTLLAVLPRVLRLPPFVEVLGGVGDGSNRGPGEERARVKRGREAPSSGGRTLSWIKIRQRDHRIEERDWSPSVR